MKQFIISLIIISVFILSGCYAQKYVASAVDKPTMISGAAAEIREYTVIKHFSVTDRSGWFILGLIPFGHTDLNEIIFNEIKASGGDAVINLKIETKYDIVDILIGILVGGIYNTRVSIIEGDIIKYK